MVNRFNEAWSAGARDVLGVAACGAGKSVIAAHVIHNESAASVFIAHRSELISGESLALARNGVRHRVIGQPALRRECSRRHIAEGLYDHIDPNARVAIASVDTLVGLPAHDPWIQSVRLAVTDECFPAGTLVDGVPIEELRVGDAVTAFNDRTGKFSAQRIARLFKNPMPDAMARITLSNEEQVLHCTLGHPFWTRRGWIPAGELIATDEVYYDELHAMRVRNIGNNRTPTVSASKNGTDILHEGVRVCIPNCAREETKSVTANSCELHNVRQRIPANWLAKIKTSKNWACVLQSRMRRCVSRAAIFRNHVKYESEVCVYENDTKQSNDVRRCAPKSERYVKTNCASAARSRRKRATRYGAGTCAKYAICRAGIYSTVCNKNRNAAGQRRISAMLQAGLGKSEVENCNRSGRSKSLGDIQAGARCKKGRVFAWIRVGRVEVYKRDDLDKSDACYGDGYVYNIEVENDHTYIANGVVVHNCHHLLRDNKWGRALEMFPNARGLGLTATPLRADGKGLGRHADGVFDILIEGPTAREIELMGFLTPHKIYAPPSDLDLSSVTVSASGDYSPKLLAAATHKSHIVGDVVQHYLRLAPGKLGMTFAVDVLSAGEIAQAFRNAGVAAEVVTGKTPADVRNTIFRRFRAGEIQQLVSCEIAGEGFDLPDVAVISLARATESYGLATQQIGRVKRILAGKDCGIVIDHVGNTQRHCTAKQCPATGEWYISVGEREWSLDRRERRASSKTPQIALTTCPSCLQVYERVLGRTCPYCKNSTEPAGRSAPEMVDGELAELDPQVLAQMQGEVARIDGAPQIPYGATPAIQGAVLKRHRERQEAQRALRHAMTVYGGWRVASGADLGRAQREWYHEFGTDVLSAQALGKADADALRERVEARLRAAGIAVDNAVSLA